MNTFQTQTGLTMNNQTEYDFSEFFAKVQEYSDSPSNDYNCREWKDELCAVIDHQDFNRFQKAVEYVTGGGFAIVKALKDESSLFVIADGYWKNVKSHCKGTA